MDTALSRREREVAGLVAEGLTNREIAERLVISERTAEGHVEQIRNKLGFHSRTQIATWVATERTGGPPIAQPPLAGAIIDVDADRAAPAKSTGIVATPRPSTGNWRLVAALALTITVVGGAFAVWPRAHPALLHVYAGIGSRGFSGDGGPATAAQVDEITSMGFGADGRLYFADSNRPAKPGAGGTSARTRIRVIDRSGNIATFAGDPAQAECFCTSHSRVTAGIAPGAFIAVGPDDAVYVVAGDPSGGWLGRIDQDGNFVWIAGGGVGRGVPLEAAPRRTALVGTLQVGVGPDGAAYVIQDSKGWILRVPDQGPVSAVAGTGENGYSGDGAAAADARLNAPRAARFSHDGALFIADTYNHRIRAVDHGGTIRTVAGDGNKGFAGDGGPAPAAELAEPGDLAFGADGELYVADTGNGRVRVIAKDGTIRTLVGPEQGLQLPTALAVDAHGSLYIADSGTHQIYSVVRQ